MLKATVVFLTCVSVSFAQVSLMKLEEKPIEFANKQGCYISDLKDVIPFGEGEPSKTACQRYNCREDFVQIVGCGVAAAVPPCYVTQDLSLVHPACCPTIKCPKEEEVEECDEEV
ncbi:U-scoloptoxin(16)-Cw1a [Bicyclus anynana]|uniref:U-scoloptoxin(16)-Cw1a n=1 Tax=Bicyclus anynana TaxID=110368 RepID=A0ABM3M813_BICAN|nr:U-scoloptoxin(16)-Cw1a [Bicyclus anynana]